MAVAESRGGETPAKMEQRKGKRRSEDRRKDFR